MSTYAMELYLKSQKLGIIEIEATMMTALKMAKGYLSPKYCDRV